MSPAAPDEVPRAVAKARHVIVIVETGE